MSSDNIKVVVRARPYKNSNNEFISWRIDKNEIYQIDEDNTPIGDTYSYDEVFDINTKNVDIYDTAVSSLVRSAIEGINLTIFAYGATSSGKTYTMNGVPEDPGTIPRFIEDIFDQVELYSQRKFLIRVSYVEIYSEIINDLLDKSKKDLKIREDINNCVSYNPKEQIVKTSTECMRVMKMGTYNRTVGETQMNLSSSRSHAIFRIVIESAPRSGGENDPVQVSHVNLIDLAGSERVSQTGATGQRFKEGAHINKSLTALGLVMKQLVEKSEYINYRDSKLTRILSNSLGGNAKTLIICNINLESLEDTASTLMFAQRAKAVKNKPKVNEVMTEAALTKKYAKECAEVKRLLESEFEKNKQLEVERDMSNKKISELDSRIKSLQEIFVKKDPVVRPPKRRHTICTLGAISEERELENASRNLITVGLRSEEDSSRSSEMDNTFSPPRRNSCGKALESVHSTDITPTKNLKDRLEILTREHEDLIEYTRLEKFENEAMTKEYRLLSNECQDLRLRVEAHVVQLKTEQEKTEQLKIDYEFLFESQKKNFERRETELLEQINKLSTKCEVNEPVSLENLPLPNSLTIGTFEYEELSEKIESCKNQIEDLQNNNKSLKLENGDLNVLIADLRNSVNTLELQNSQLKIKNKSLQSKVVDMEVKSNNTQVLSNESSLKKQIQTLEANNNKLESELGKVKDELYESQDKLMDLTQDLDIEERKSSRLEKQLTEERELRQKVELELSTEVKLRKDAESDLERLRLEIVSKVVKGEELEQEFDSEIVKGQDAETQLLEEENEAADSTTTEVNWKQDIESELVKEIELRQKLELELVKEKKLLIEAESKYLEEVELRKEIKQTLLMLQNILGPKSQQKDLSTENTNTIILNIPKESVSEYKSLQDTSEIRSESDFDTSDAFLDYITPNESLQEIHPENLESFSSSYFKDSRKSNDFKNFFNSFVNNDNEVSQQKQNNQETMDDKDEKHESNINELEKLRKDSNFMKLQRESDIMTINQLQAQLEEYGNMNLSDTEKISKTNKILEALNILEIEKADNISVIQTLKQQLQNEAAKFEELQRIFEIKSDDLKKKNEEIQILNEKIGSEADVSKKNSIESNSAEPNLEKEIYDLHQRNINLEQQIESQKNELEKNISSLNEKETYLQNLSEENRILRKKIEEECSEFKQDEEITKQISVQMELYKTQLNEMVSQIQEKDTIILQVNQEKMKIESEIKSLQEDKYILEKKLASQSQAITSLSEEFDIKNTSNIINTAKEEKEENKMISSEENQLDGDLNTIKCLRKEIENLSVSNKEKEAIIARIESEKINLEKEKCHLSDGIEELKIQVEMQINHLKQSSEIIENNGLSSEKLTEENNILKLERKEIQSTLEEEYEKNNNLLKNIENLKIDSEILSVSLREKEIIVAKMNEEKMKLQEELNSLYAQMKRQEENKISDQDQITDLLSNIPQLKNRIDDMLIDIQNKETIIVKIDSEKITLQKEKSDLNDKINDLIIQVETKTNQIAELSEILDNKELSSQKILEENQLMKKECEQSDLTLKEERKQHAELLKHIEELEVKLNKMSLEKEVIIASIEEERSNLNEERNNLSAKLNDLSKELERQRIETSKESINQNNIEEMKNEIEKLSIVIQDKDTHIATINLENTKLVEEREKMERLLKRTEELEIKLNKYSLSETELEMTILKLNGEKSNLEKEKNDLSLKVSDMYREIEQQRLEVETLNQDKETILQNNMKLKNEIEKLLIGVQDKDKSISTTNLEKIKLHEERKDLFDKINTLTTQIQKQTDHLAELSEIIKNKELSSQKLEKENEMLRSDLEQINLITTEIEKLKIDNKNLVLSVEEKEIIITQINAEKTNLEEQINDISARMNDLLAQTEKQDRKIKRQSEILEDKELRIQKLLKEHEKLKEENKENAFLLKSERIKYEDISRDIEELKKENSKLLSSVKELSKKNIEEINEIRSVEECSKKEKDFIVAKMEEQRVENEKEKLNLLDEINSFRATVETQMIKLNELQEIINNKEIYIKKLESQYRNLEQDIKKKELLCAKEKDQIEMQEQYSKEIDEMKRANSGLMEAFDVVQNINADLKNQLLDLRADYSEKLGDYITNMKALLGIEEQKSLRSWKVQQKLETKWEDLKNIEKQICSIIKKSTSNDNYKTKFEDANRMNDKLTTQIQSLEEQKKFLQMTLEQIRKEREVALLDYEKKLEQANKKLKTMSVTYEQDKKKMENLEYELRAISKKTKSTGNSNHQGEKDGTEHKSSEVKWKHHRAEAHDSRRSIDLNTLCSESNVFRCRCENMDEKVKELKSEVSQLKEWKDMLSLKYEKAKKLCRLRNDEINELKEKLRICTSV